MNVIDTTVIAELSAIVEQVAADAAVKGVVITSGKDTFCAGADLTMLELLSRSFAELVASQGEEAAQCPRVRGKPQTLAAVPPDRDVRQAMGRGDQRHRGRRRLRVDARVPSSCCRRQRQDAARSAGDQGRSFSGRRRHQRIARILPPADALQFLLKGDQISVNRAKAMKLIDAVVPPGDLVKAAKDWIKTERHGQGAVGHRRASSRPAGRSIPRPA